VPALVNLVTVTRALGGAGPVLEIVRLDGNETTVIPFMSEGLPIHLHYCEQPDIGPGYVRCNQETENGRCLLCDVGRHRDERYLLPVYLPEARVVGILAVSLSLRPKSLLAQLLAHLERTEPVVLFIRREGANFTVASAPLPPGADDGANVIGAFRERFDCGEIVIESAFTSVPNSRLAVIPEIAHALALRGKTP
jgi:hypothetical protein